MDPVIREGELVISRVVDPVSLQVSNVISFREGDSVVTHRIVGLTEKDGEAAFITKGDADNTNDVNPVKHSQVEGIQIFKIPAAGHLAMSMQTPAGMLTFIGIPLCAFFLYSIFHRRLTGRKGKIRSSKKQSGIIRPGDLPDQAQQVCQ